jgi:hypothetical protein
MVVKEFEIDYNGEKAVIGYEDELTFGEIESILQKSVDLSDISKPKMNIPQYRMDILMKVIRTAPFKTGDAVALRNQKAGTVQQIISGVMKDYPLGRFLTDWVETFGGVGETEKNSTNYTTS